MEVTDEESEQYVADALERLPEGLMKLLDNVVILIEPKPLAAGPTSWVERLRATSTADCRLRLTVMYRFPRLVR